MSNAKEIEKQAKSLSSINIFSFRFSVDHDQVASLYEKAANLYKGQKKLESAVRCFECAGKHHQKAGNLFHSGKAWENAAVIYRELKDITKAIKAYKAGAELLIEDGKLDRAAECLVKATKAIEKDLGKDGTLSPENRNTMSSLFKEALRMYATGDKFHMSTNTFRAYNAFLLKNKMYLECIENIKNQNKAYVALKQSHNVWKNNLSMVIIQLQHDGDYLAAGDLHEASMKKYADYATTKECEISAQLIQAFENNDHVQLSEIIADRDLKYLEPQVSKIVMKLQIKQNPTLVRRPPRNVRSKEEEELFGTDEKEASDASEVNNANNEDIYVNEPDALDEDNLC